MDSLFNIGQKVICVDSSVSTAKKIVPYCPLIEGKVYTVKDTKTCTCGNVAIHVGIKVTGLSVCQLCNKRFPTAIWWFSQKRFVPVEMDELVNEIVNYQTQEI